MSVLFLSVLCCCFLHAVLSRLGGLPQELQQLIIDRVGDSRSVASFRTASKSSRDFIDYTKELSFHQARFGALQDKYDKIHIHRFVDREMFLDNMIEYVDYICRRKSSIKLEFVDSDSYRTKLNLLATELVNNTKKCNQFPVLIMRTFPPKILVKDISHRIRIEVVLRTEQLTSNIMFVEGIHSINLTDCQFTKVPNFLKHLPKTLRHLNLEGSSIEKHLGQLRQLPEDLMSLDLTRCDIGSKIVELDQLPVKLESLDLSNNCIGKFIGQLNELPVGLKTLILSKNKISGEHIGDLQTLPVGLKVLDVSWNCFGEAIGNLQELPARLEKLYLGSLFTVGKHIKDLKTLPVELKVLSLRDNNIGNHIGSLQKLPDGLESLDLSNNYIFKDIGCLKTLPVGLKVLSLGDNNIGNHIGSLQKLPYGLESLDLSFNSIKEYIKYLKPLPGRLRTLNLSHNNIGRYIRNLQKLPDGLRFLNLRRNSKAAYGCKELKHLHYKFRLTSHERIYHKKVDSKENDQLDILVNEEKEYESLFRGIVRGLICLTIDIVYNFIRILI